MAGAGSGRLRLYRPPSNLPVGREWGRIKHLRSCVTKRARARETVLYRFAGRIRPEPYGVWLSIFAEERTISAPAVRRAAGLRRWHCWDVRRTRVCVQMICEAPPRAPSSRGGVSLLSRGIPSTKQRRTPPSGATRCGVRTFASWGDVRSIKAAV